jgi:Fe-S cluster assembly protein SufD
VTLLTLPSNREEGWRWSDLGAIESARKLSRFVTKIDRSTMFVGIEGPRLVFIDGYYDPDWSDPADFELHPVSLQSAHPLGRFAAGPGFELRFKPDSATTLQILHVSTGEDDQLAMHLRIDEGAAVSVVETFVGTGWTNRLTRIDAAPAARLMHAVRLMKDEGFVSLRAEGTLQAGASLVTTMLAAGAMDSRVDGEIELAGEGAYAEAGGALLGRGRQRHDINLVVRHSAPGGTSRQVWRSVADERATCSVAARVEVARDAQKTDGEQSLRGLLLARTATINAKPELEIFADDVKCAHGATVGELDRNALFYLASRGVTPGEAKALLTRAFVDDALARIGEDAAREAFEADAGAWLDNPSPISGEGGARRVAAGG